MMASVRNNFANKFVSLEEMKIDIYSYTLNQIRNDQYPLQQLSNRCNS
jgi:hypothetical protein